MDYFTHVVSKIWYRIYWGWMVATSLAVLAGTVLALYIPGYEHFGQTYGLNGATLILTLLFLVYSCSAYFLLIKRYQTLALLICTLLHVLIVFNGLILTKEATASWVYTSMWCTHAFFVGLYGLPILLSAFFLNAVFVLLQNAFMLNRVRLSEIVLTVGYVAISLPGFFFWRKKFVDVNTQQISRLSGMLRSNQQQSEILIQSIADGVIVVNTDGKITLINPAASAMTQWPTSEATGLDVQLVAKLAKEGGEDINVSDNPFNVILKQKKHVSQNAQLLGREGRKQIISLVISPVMIGAGDMAGAVAVMRDISAQRAEEQQRAEFISTASHEMRTPVAAIEGYLALALNDKVSTIDSRARSFLEKAHSSTQHLGQLFQDLLTSAKAEDGRLSNHPVVIEMGSYLEQLVEDLKFTAQKKGLPTEFVVGVGEAIDATNPEAASTTALLKVVKPLYYVHADPDRLREVMTNLFDNACKYTDQGKITIGLTGNNDVVQFYVRDTGTGIPAEDVPHLFQKFYRIDNSATRTIGGTGLGLFISRKIIELYQGRIWVDSHLGKGSTFFINLPRLTPQRAEQLQEIEASQTPAPTTSKAIVENTPSLPPAPKNTAA